MIRRTSIMENELINYIIKELKTIYDTESLELILLYVKGKKTGN